MNRIQELEKFAACKGMGEQELMTLAEAMSWHEYPAGHVLFSEGDTSTMMFFLYQGSLLISMHRDGHEEELARMEPGSIAGEMGALLDEPRSAAARALTDIAVGKLKRDTLLRWVEERELVALHLILNVLKVMAVRLRRVNAKLFELGASKQIPSKMRADLAEFRQKLFTTWSF